MHRLIFFRRLLIAALMSLALGSVSPGQTTVSSPSRLEVNLGPIPFDAYDQSPSGHIPGCSAATVRQCFQTALSGYAAQGVRTVRFQFGLRGAAGSTPMSSTGISKPHG